MNKIDVVGMKKKHGDFRVTIETITVVAEVINSLVDAVKELQREDRKAPAGDSDEDMEALAKSMAAEMRSGVTAVGTEAESKEGLFSTEDLEECKDEYIETAPGICEGDELGIVKFIHWIREKDLLAPCEKCPLRPICGPKVQAYDVDCTKARSLLK